jgi:hypothetical protein
MANESLKLRPGVDQNATPALNEAGISSSNLIRFAYNRQGLGLVQKLGGWQKFYGQQLPAAARALTAWEDVNANLHLAVGAQNNGSGVPTLGVITGGSLVTITPRSTTESIRRSSRRQRDRPSSPSPTPPRPASPPTTSSTSRPTSRWAA